MARDVHEGAGAHEAKRSRPVADHLEHDVVAREPQRPAKGIGVLGGERCRSGGTEEQDGACVFHGVLTVISTDATKGHGPGGP